MSGGGQGLEHGAHLGGTGGLESLVVSFDVFVQRFRDGNAAPLSPGVFHEVFGPHVDRREPEHRLLHVRTADGGEADVYADADDPGSSSLMVNHFSGEMVSDLIVEYARRADAVILPAGCPTLLTSAEQRQHLPEALSADVRVVSDGPGFLAAIRG